MAALTQVDAAGCARRPLRGVEDEQFLARLIADPKFRLVGSEADTVRATRDGLRADENAMRRPSGDQAGYDPNVVKRRADSPVAPATKMPPPRRLYAICFPSGE